MTSQRAGTQTHFLVIAALALAAITPMLLFGITSGNDLPQHFQFAQTAHDALLSGDIYPGFAANPNDGLGDVGLRFYPPLAYYALSGAYFVFGDWYYAGQLVFLLIFFFGGVGVYLWTREALSEQYALMAAAIFTFAPYHLNLIYNNSLVAEFAATAVFPFCFYYVTRICRGDRWQGMTGLAISYALLICTHLPSTVIVSIALLLYSLLMIEKPGWVKTLAKLGSAVVIALLASSFYWARMISEIDWLKHADVKYFSDTFDYHANFLFTPQNIINFQSDVLSLWLADLMLLATILAAVPTLFAILSRGRSGSRFLRVAATLFIVGIFMATPLSSPVWSSLGFLQKVQFPWRWLGVITVFGAILAAVGLVDLGTAMRGKSINLTTAGVGVAFAFFVFISVFLVKQAVYIPHGQFALNTAGLARNDSYIGWWPIWARESAHNMVEKVDAAGRSVEIHAFAALERSFTVGPGMGGDVRVRTFYYPHWHARVNGSPVPVIADADGLITFPAPPGAADVELSFDETASVHYMYYISIVTWVGLGIFAGRNAFRRRKTS